MINFTNYNLISKRFRATLKHLMMSLAVFGVLVSTLISINANAQFVNASNEGCKVKGKITMTDILNPGSFFPVIPAECSTSNGKPVPLSIALIPDIAIRFFGALASFIFYLFFVITTVTGIMWIYGGIDPSQATQAKKNFQDAFVGLVLVVSVYMVVNTVLISLLRVRFTYTDMDSFFTI